MALLFLEEKKVFFRQTSLWADDIQKNEGQKQTILYKHSFRQIVINLLILLLFSLFSWKKRP